MSDQVPAYSKSPLKWNPRRGVIVCDHCQEPKSAHLCDELGGGLVRYTCPESLSSK